MKKIFLTMIIASITLNGCSQQTELEKVLHNYKTTDKGITEIKQLLVVDINARVKSSVEGKEEVAFQEYMDDQSGATALIIAADNGYADIVKALINSNADVNIQDDKGLTALMCASWNGNLEIVQELIAAKADVTPKSEGDNRTALWMAARQGHAQIIALLIDAKSDIEAKETHDFTTPLFAACENGHAEVVKILLAAKANVNATAYENNITPLMAAARNGNKDIVEMLIEHGADVHAKDDYGNTAFDFANELDSQDIAKLLK